MQRKFLTLEHCVLWLYEHGQNTKTFAVSDFSLIRGHETSDEALFQIQLLSI